MKIFQKLLFLIKTLILGLIIVFVFYFLSNTAIHYTGQPGFCNNCHLMNSYYQSWSASSHKNVNCYSCHSEPGTIGLLKIKLKGMQDVYLTIMNLPVQPKDDHAFDRCSECHRNLNVSKPKTKDLNFKHQVHQKAGLTCIKCHTGVVHSPKEKVSMEFCIDCHANNPKDGAPTTDCKSCHGSKKGQPSSHKVVNWQTSHGQAFIQNRQYCIVCHSPANPANPNALWASPTYCINCHTTKNPHDSNWVNTHGSQRLNLDKCSFCHNRNFCSKCHFGE